jgi:hypothetical protein
LDVGRQGLKPGELSPFASFFSHRRVEFVGYRKQRLKQVCGIDRSAPDPFAKRIVDALGNLP